MTSDANPLLSDRDVDFLLFEVHDAASLCALPAFADHDRGTFELTVQTVRRLARDVFFPALRDTDATPPVLRDGAERARAVADGVLARVRRASGLR